MTVCSHGPVAWHSDCYVRGGSALGPTINNLTETTRHVLSDPTRRLWPTAASERLEIP